MRALVEHGLGRLRARKQSRRYGARALVLAYHRIAEAENDPLGLCVSPDHFTEHLEVLRGFGEPVRLDRLPHALMDASPTRTLLCVTFDDGYADNLHAALPLLQRHDVPATVFVVSGQHGRGEEFWWDEIDRILSFALPSAPLPLEIGLEREEERALRPDPSALSRALHDRLYDCSDPERAFFLNQLRNWIGVPLKVRPSHAVLSTQQLQQLGGDELIEIGAHTVNHPLLDRLEIGEQRREIRESKRQIQGVLGSEISSFAYPHGRFGVRTPMLVEEAGFSRACTVEPGAVWRASDPWRLPRVLVTDGDGEHLARRLRRWLSRPPAGVSLT